MSGATEITTFDQFYAAIQGANYAIIHFWVSANGPPGPDKEFMDAEARANPDMKICTLDLCVLPMPPPSAGIPSTVVYRCGEQWISSGENGDAPLPALVQIVKQQA